MQLPQFTRNGQITTRVSEADRRRQIKSSLGATSSWLRPRHQTVVLKKFDDQRIAFRGKSSGWIMFAARDGMEFHAEYLGHFLRTFKGLNSIVIAMDDEDGTT